MAKSKTGRFLISAQARSEQKKKQVYEHPANWNDLSEVEEKGDNGFLIDIGAQAATNAINENKAMNLPITFMEDGWVVRRMPHGNIERIIEIAHSIERPKERKLTKGTVLHVKKSR